MILIIPKILILNRFGKCPVTFSDSFGGLLKWLCYSQDCSGDGGSSAGYSLWKNWLVSYPETTGYIIWTLINQHKLFGGVSWLKRVERMVLWEQSIQWKEGGMPGSYKHPSEEMVVFNTGMVLIGMGAYLREIRDDGVLESALKAADWIISCQDESGVWSRGYSRAVSGGNLTFHTMVAWGLSELYVATGIERFKESALKAAYYYAQFIGEAGWPDHSGLSDHEDRYNPLTHTVGYTFSGLYETGHLLNDESLKKTAMRISSGLEGVVAGDGFISGRILPGFQSSVRWACLPGSAQIAYSWLRIVEDGTRGNDLLDKALSVLDYIRRTQRVGTGNVGIDYGVLGSYPFSLSGYCRLTYPNWAAKFTVDCYHVLYKLSKTGAYEKKLKRLGFDLLDQNVPSDI